MKKITNHLSFFITFLFLTNFSVAQTWTQKDTLPDVGRMASFGFSISGKGYICNGYGPSSILKELWEYDPVNNSWTQKSSFLDSARSGIGATVSGRAFVGVGYNPNSSTYYYEFYEYIPSINGWVKKSNYPGNGPRNNMMVGANGRIYSGGGLKTSQGYVSDFWEYNPVTDTWSRITSNWPLGDRASGVSFAYDSLVFFGMGYNGVKNLNDIWAYNTYTDIWKKYSTFPDSGRIHPVAINIGDKVIIGGGHQHGVGQSLSDYYVLDLTTNTWSSAITHPTGERSVASAFNIGNKGYLFGGKDSISNYMNDLWQVEFILTSIFDNKDNQSSIFEVDNIRHGKLSLSLKEKPFRGEIELISVDGKLVDRAVLSANRVVLDVANLKPSIYFIRFTDNNRSFTKKIILGFD